MEGTPAQDAGLLEDDLVTRVDGQPVTTPYAFDSVVGIVRTIEAVTPQAAGAVTYTWTGWNATWA